MLDLWLFKGPVCSKWNSRDHSVCDLRVNSVISMSANRGKEEVLLSNQAGCHDLHCGGGQCPDWLSSFEGVSSQYTWTDVSLLCTQPEVRKTKPLCIPFGSASSAECHQYCYEFVDATLL